MNNLKVLMLWSHLVDRDDDDLRSAVTNVNDGSLSNIDIKPMDSDEYQFQEVTDLLKFIENLGYENIHIVLLGEGSEGRGFELDFGRDHNNESIKKWLSFSEFPRLSKSLKTDRHNCIMVLSCEGDHFTSPEAQAKIVDQIKQNVNFIYCPGSYYPEESHVFLKRFYKVFNMIFHLDLAYELGHWAIAMSASQRFPLRKHKFEKPTT